LVEGTCDHEYFVKYHWSATDDCGNFVEASYEVDVYDDVAPRIHGAPKDTREKCSDVSDACDLEVTDNCDEGLTTSLVEVVIDGTCDDEYTIIRTWMSEDACGNAAEESQTIEVYDPSAPVLKNLPSHKVVQCDDVPDPCTVTAWDNCLEAYVEVGYLETREDVSEHEYTLYRTWEVSDACGNTDSYTQTITVVDSTPPRIKGPKNEKVEVHEVASSADDEITVNDNCDEPNVTESEWEEEGTCEYGYIIIRQWTATDGSDNTATFTQTITVSDTTAPVLHGIPADLVVEHLNVPPLADALLTVYVTDNSGATDLIATVRERKISGDTDNEYVLIRTFCAVDDCGNKACEAQTITVVDTTPPVLPPPDDITVECDAVPAPCVVNAEDEETLPVDYSEEIVGDVSSGSYLILRTWSVTDESGNTATQTQTVFVEDSSAPVLSRYPADEDVSCNCESFPTAPTLYALDNCDDSVEVTFTETQSSDRGSNEDNYVLIRTWTASDRSGNTASHTQTITVSDTEAPYLSNNPEDYSSSCSMVPATPSNAAFDNCDPDASVSFTSTRAENGCASDYTETRTWTATDRSGNSRSHVQTVTVFDNTAPDSFGDAVTCLWPANDAVVEVADASSSVFHAADDCGEVTVSILSCDSSMANASRTDFNDYCTYDAASDVLSLTASNDDMRNGHTINVHASLTDECGNTRTVQKDYWVPPEHGDALTANLSCISAEEETSSSTR